MSKTNINDGALDFNTHMNLNVDALEAFFRSMLKPVNNNEKDEKGDDAKNIIVVKNFSFEPLKRIYFQDLYKSLLSDEKLYDFISTSTADNIFPGDNGMDMKVTGNAVTIAGHTEQATGSPDLDKAINSKIDENALGPVEIAKSSFHSTIEFTNSSSDAGRRKGLYDPSQVVEANKNGDMFAGLGLLEKVFDEEEKLLKQDIEREKYVVSLQTIARRIIELFARLSNVRLSMLFWTDKVNNYEKELSVAALDIFYNLMSRISEAHRINLGRENYTSSVNVTETVKWVEGEDTRPIDVLFWIDVSPSMEDVIEAVIKGINPLIKQVKQYNKECYIGFIEGPSKLGASAKLVCNFTKNANVVTTGLKELYKGLKSTPKVKYGSGNEGVAGLMNFMWDSVVYDDKCLYCYEEHGEPMISTVKNGHEVKWIGGHKRIVIIMSDEPVDNYTSISAVFERPHHLKSNDTKANNKGFGDQDWVNRMVETEDSWLYKYFNGKNEKPKWGYKGTEAKNWRKKHYNTAEVCPSNAKGNQPTVKVYKMRYDNRDAERGGNKIYTEQYDTTIYKYYGLQKKNNGNGDWNTYQPSAGKSSNPYWVTCRDWQFTNSSEHHGLECPGPDAKQMTTADSPGDFIGDSKWHDWFNSSRKRGNIFRKKYTGMTQSNGHPDGVPNVANMRIPVYNDDTGDAMTGNNDVARPYEFTRKHFVNAFINPGYDVLHPDFEPANNASQKKKNKFQEKIQNIQNNTTELHWIYVKDDQTLSDEKNTAIKKFQDMIVENILKPIAFANNNNGAKMRFCSKEKDESGNSIKEQLENTFKAIFKERNYKWKHSYVEVTKTESVSNDWVSIALKYARAARLNKTYADSIRPCVFVPNLVSTMMMFSQSWKDYKASSEFSDTSTYKVGDLCRHTVNGTTLVYQCKVAITTPETWNESKWQRRNTPFWGSLVNNVCKLENDAFPWFARSNELLEDPSDNKPYLLKDGMYSTWTANDHRAEAMNRGGDYAESFTGIHLKLLNNNITNGEIQSELSEGLKILANAFEECFKDAEVMKCLNMASSPPTPTNLWELMKSGQIGNLGDLQCSLILERIIAKVYSELNVMGCSYFKAKHPMLNLDFALRFLTDATFANNELEKSGSNKYRVAYSNVLDYVKRINQDPIKSTFDEDSRYILEHVIAENEQSVKNSLKYLTRTQSLCPYRWQPDEVDIKKPDNVAISETEVGGNKENYKVTYERISSKLLCPFAETVHPTPNDEAPEHNLHGCKLRYIYSLDQIEDIKDKLTAIPPICPCRSLASRLLKQANIADRLPAPTESSSRDYIHALFKGVSQETNSLLDTKSEETDSMGYSTSDLITDNPQENLPIITFFAGCKVESKTSTYSKTWATDTEVDFNLEKDPVKRNVAIIEGTKYVLTPIEITTQDDQIVKKWALTLSPTTPPESGEEQEMRIIISQTNDDGRVASGNSAEVDITGNILVKAVGTVPPPYSEEEHSNVRLVYLDQLIRLCKDLFKFNMRLAFDEPYLKTKITKCESHYYGDLTYGSFEPLTCYRFSNFHASNGRDERSAANNVLKLKFYARNLNQYVTAVNRDLSGETSFTAAGDQNLKPGGTWTRSDRQKLDNEKVVPGSSVLESQLSYPSFKGYDTTTDKNEDTHEYLATTDEIESGIIDPAISRNQNISRGSSAKRPLYAIHLMDELKDGNNYRFNSVETALTTLEVWVKRFRPIFLPNAEDLFKSDDRDPMDAGNNNKNIKASGWSITPHKYTGDVHFAKDAIIIPMNMTSRNSPRSGWFNELDYDFHVIHQQGTAIISGFYDEAKDNVSIENGQPKTSGREAADLPLYHYRDWLYPAAMLKNLRVEADHGALLSLTDDAKTIMETCGSDGANDWTQGEKGNIEIYKIGSTSTLAISSNNLKYFDILKCIVKINDPVVDQSTALCANWLYITAPAIGEGVETSQCVFPLPWVFWHSSRGSGGVGPNNYYHGLGDRVVTDHETSFNDGTKNGMRFFAVSSVLAQNPLKMKMFGRQEDGYTNATADKFYKGFYDPSCAGLKTRWETHGNPYYGWPNGSDNKDGPRPDKYCNPYNSSGQHVLVGDSLTHKETPNGPFDQLGLNKTIIKTLIGKPATWSLWNIMRQSIWYCYKVEDLDYDKDRQNCVIDRTTVPVTNDEINRKTSRSMRELYREWYNRFTYGGQYTSYVANVNDNTLWPYKTEPDDPVTYGEAQRLLKGRAETVVGGICNIEWTNVVADISIIYNEVSDTHNSCLTMYTGGHPNYSSQHTDTASGEFRGKKTDLTGVSGVQNTTASTSWANTAQVPTANNSIPFRYALPGVDMCRNFMALTYRGYNSPIPHRAYSGSWSKFQPHSTHPKALLVSREIETVNHDGKVLTRNTTSFNGSEVGNINVYLRDIYPPSEDNDTEGCDSNFLQRMLIPCYPNWEDLHTGSGNTAVPIPPDAVTDEDLQKIVFCMAPQSYYDGLADGNGILTDEIFFTKDGKPHRKKIRPAQLGERMMAFCISQIFTGVDAQKMTSTLDTEFFAQVSAPNVKIIGESLGHDYKPGDPPWGQAGATAGNFDPNWYNNPS